MSILLSSGSIVPLVYAQSTAYTTPSELAKILLPLQQVKGLGFLPNHVICHDDPQLIIKAEDDSPACVKPVTTEKLLKRVWEASWCETFRCDVPNPDVISFQK